ncbi:MAG: hypothetical protein MPW16_20855 (plasmid) [Candidatus Manganitrophus sp.]|nr:MAG: hypothetical protein MPW16_20855 [Candidatus Manganitrophus sp.]
MTDLASLAIEPEGAVVEREVRAPFVSKALTRYELRSPARRDDHRKTNFSR